MIRKIFFFSTLLVLVSCNFDGVKSNTDDSNEADNIIKNNTSKDSLVDIDEDKPLTLLKDSVDGVMNNMVYNGVGGLRVEWTVRNETNPIELNDVVMVNYTARVAAGEVYDSNSEIGEPVPLKTNIGMMIKGWEAGLLKMHVGDVGRIMIPNALAYGEDGYIDVVPPKADIIVEIEIVSKIEPILLAEGVKVYKWKKNKNGAIPTKNQRITFDYFAYTKGPKGKRYDNSFKNSEPFSFKFENDNVIDGLHQGMSAIHSKENAFIEIPANLAYGKSGLLDLVPKNTDIVYDVRIISID